MIINEVLPQDLFTTSSPTFADLQLGTTLISSTTDSNASGDTLIGIPVIDTPTPTWTTQAHHNRLFASSGRATGGEITDAGGGAIDVAAGTGFIKATDSDTAELLSFNWGAESSIAITTDSIKFVGIRYNAGSPEVVIYDTISAFDYDTDFPLGTVVNENDVLHILNSPWWVTDPFTNILERFHADGHIIRDLDTGGLILSVTGTRNIAVTAGKLWHLLTEIPIAAIDTSVSGTVEYYYYSTDAGWADSDVSQYSVLQYNDTTQTAGNELVNMTVNRHANIWVYAEADDTTIALVYPQAQYVLASDAEAESPPTLLPPHILENGILIGRIIIKQNTATPIDVQSAFGQTYTSATATDHGVLGGLTDNDHPQYILGSTFTTNNYFLVGTGAGTYAEESPANARLSLGLGTTDSPQFTDLTLTNDLLLASGSILNWNSGDILLTHSANTLTFSGMSTLDLGSSILVTTGAAKGGEVWVTGPTSSGPCKMLNAGGFWGFHATGHTDTGIFRFYGEKPKTGNNTTALNLYGRGDPSDNTIRERLNISHKGGSLASIFSEASGTGTGVRSLTLYTGANSNQLYLHKDGMVGINTAFPDASYAFDVNGAIQASSLYVVGEKVVGPQEAAVADATGAGDVVAQLNALLDRIRGHGLIDS